LGGESFFGFSGFVVFFDGLFLGLIFCPLWGFLIQLDEWVGLVGKNAIALKFRGNF